jgi:D-ala D-ala ligase C-terminus
VIVLPPLATRPGHAAFYDARAKMDPRGESLVAYEAAVLPAGDDQLLRDLSLRIGHETGCAGMARIDCVMGPSGPSALEVNTVPGLAQGSNFITAASLAGITYPYVILALLNEACTARSRTARCPRRAGATWSRRRKDPLPNDDLLPRRAHASPADRPGRVGRSAAQLAGWLSLVWATKVLTAGKARSGRSRKMV